MAILAAVNVEQGNVVPARNRPFSGFAQDRPRAKVWGNWGIMMDGEFVPVPLGTPIDTMEPASTTGQNAGAVAFNAKKNKVLLAFQRIGASMAPGETRFVEARFQLRRVSDDLEIVPDENELDVDDIVALLTSKPKPAQAKRPRKAKAG